MLPNRDAADEVAQAISYRFGPVQHLMVVRDSVTAERSDRGTQFLMTVEDPEDQLSLAELDQFVADWDGWREESQ
jgi:hypothetical protein